MTTIDVFDPALCCNSGVCGAEVDQDLVDFSGIVHWATSRGASVERHNLAQQPQDFAGNPVVAELLRTDGAAALPVTLVDGRAQPTVSHHMKILVDAGILDREQRGRWAYFRLVPGALEAATGGLTAVAAGTLQTRELEGIR